MSDIQSQSCGFMGGENALVDSVYDHLTAADAPLAMSYVPCQQWEILYDPCTALKVGTVFESLCKPFCGKGGKCW
ncbi:MAG: spore coat associated protein CotJA [Lachnospiraceae bacterium]|nr:spore coat associated protein CotJA [Lachnospiraceae bacterium]